jgi:hypothetical protein
MSSHVLNVELNCYIGNIDRPLETSETTLALKSEFRTVLNGAQSQRIGLADPFAQQYSVKLFRFLKLWLLTAAAKLIDLCAGLH